MRSLRPLAVIVVALFVALHGARALSAQLLYPGSPRVLPVPDDVARVALASSDGAAIHALMLEGPAKAPVVVAFHNNRETAEQGIPLARALREHGLGVVLCEYRGYGASSDLVPTEAALYADAQALLDWLETRGVDAARVVLWGQSLGTGVAAEMARRGRGRALVLVSPYTSIDRLVTGVVPFAPARVLVRDRFDTLSKASAIGVPTLIVHGDADAIVPFSMGEALARALPSARLLRVPHGTHADVLQRTGARLFSAVSALASPAIE